MLSFERARMVADYLRAEAEIHRASLGTPIALLLLAVPAIRMRPDASWLAHAALLAGLGVLPWLLTALSPKGAWPVFRLALAAFPLSALLLGVIVFREALRLPVIEAEGVPALRWLFPALSLLVPLGYLLHGLADWIRRLRLKGWIQDRLAVPPVAAYLEEPRALLAAALAAAPRREDPWAQFRTVAASARNLKLFFKLDTARHGVWRAAFADDYALVVFHDGSGCEAVAPGGIHLAADDTPRPGERERMVLVRWNGHFHEARILPDDRLKIQAWNSRSAGFDGGSSVPAPGF